MTERALVDFTIEDGVARICLHRGEARNALSLPLIQALNHTLDEVAAEASTRVVLLEGEGKCFSAGMDLKGVLEDPEAMREMLQDLAEATIRLRKFEVPTIAVVQGAAIGGGCGLAIVCDFTMSHPEAKLGYPEVDLGICPAIVAPWLSLRIGAGAARAMLLAGGLINGTEAREQGLLTHLVAREQLETEATALAEQLLKGAPEAMAATKRLLLELDGEAIASQVREGARISATIISGEEAQSRLAPIYSR